MPKNNDYNKTHSDPSVFGKPKRLKDTNDNSKADKKDDKPEKKRKWL